ncbi:MAG: hypothetical protein ACK4SY_10265 [Pyrobaculum sp.]
MYCQPHRIFLYTIIILSAYFITINILLNVINSPWLAAVASLALFFTSISILTICRPTHIPREELRQYSNYAVTMVILFSTTYIISTFTGHEATASASIMAMGVVMVLLVCALTCRSNDRE